MAGKDPDAAAKVRSALLAAPHRLIDNPRIGSPLPDYGLREIRRLSIGNYEMRYEVRSHSIEIVSIWHMREDRPVGPES